MIPKCLLELIDKYSEIGQFWIDLKTNICWWFNGKRFEFWFQFNNHLVDSYKSMKNNNTLYYIAKCELYILKNQCIKKILMPKFLKLQGKNFNRITNEIFHPNIKYVFNCDVAQYIDLIHIKTLPIKNHRYNGSKLLLRKSILYCFSPFYSEKFDLQTNKWTDIANPSSPTDVIMINGEFVQILSTLRYNIYHIKKDTWYLKTIP